MTNIAIDLISITDKEIGFSGTVKVSSKAELANKFMKKSHFTLNLWNGNILLVTPEMCQHYTIVFLTEDSAKVVKERVQGSVGG